MLKQSATTGLPSLQRILTYVNSTQSACCAGTAKAGSTSALSTMRTPLKFGKSTVARANATFSTDKEALVWL